MERRAVTTAMRGALSAFRQGPRMQTGQTGQTEQPGGGALDAELKRLDALQDALWSRATRDPGEDTDAQDKAIDRLLKIMERRHKLLGLEKSPAPQSADPVVDGDGVRFVVEIEEPIRSCPQQPPSTPESGDSSPPTGDPGTG